MKKNRNPDGSPAGDSVQPPASEHGGIMKDQNAYSTDKSKLSEHVETQREKDTEIGDALRASELSYRRLFESARDGILILNADTGRVTDVNPFLIQLLGYSHADMVGKTVGELSPFKDKLCNQAMLERLQQDGYVRYDDLPLETSDGRRISVEFVSNVYQAGEIKVIQCNIRDITERKRTEGAMIASEERYRRLFEASKSGILILNAATGLIIDVNPFLTELLGYSRETFIGKQLWDLGFFKDIAANEANFQELQAKEYIRYDNLPLETSDGRRIDVEFVSNSYLVDGHLVIQCDIRDITERKQLEATSIRLVNIVESSDDAIISKTLDGIITSWNPGAEKIFGYTALEAIGKPMLMLFPPDRANEELEILTRIANGVSVEHFETVRVRQDGKAIDISATISPLKDGSGKIIGASKIARDITERKRAEEALLLVNSVVLQARDSILITDAQLDLPGPKIMFVNPAFTSMTGYTAEEVIGKTPRIFQGPKTDKTLLLRLRQNLERGEVFTGQGINYRKDGQEFILEWHIAPIRNASGTITHFVAIQRDVTAQKSLEAQLRQSQKMESIGTLAGGIAHDLNNVLTPIMMSIELLKMKEKDERDLNILSVIEDSAKRGADMVKQILSFARGEGGEKLEVQTGSLIEEIQKIVRETFFENIVLNSNIAPDLWAMHGDPTQLHQVLLNLCLNARDAMPNGGTLTLTASNLMIDEQYAGMNIDAKLGPYVRIQLEDNGTGMSAEVKERIFEPFFTTKDIGKGTGLGLSTSLGIIKSHGGFIKVYSEVNMGTRFNIYLPALTESNAVSSLATKDLMHGNNELILLVDDEKTVRDITCVTLETFGYRVIMACDGVEATSIYVSRSEEIDLVITDMMMPLMDGPQMIQVLLKLNPELRVIAASGLNANNLLVKAASAGVKHFIPKPYTAETLLKTVREALEG